MDRQCCVIVLHINILLCSTMLLYGMFLLLYVKFLKMLVMYSNSLRSLTCNVNSKSLFSRLLFMQTQFFLTNKCIITILNVPQLWKILTLLKLKKLEKYYVMYQEKIMLPKQVKEMALIYQQKETRKEQAFCIFSSVSQCVQLYGSKFLQEKKIQLYDEAACCALRQRSATKM